MNRAARETLADEREAMSVRHLRMQMQASFALLEDDADRIEIEAKLRADLAEDIRKSGMRPVVVGE